MKVVSLFITFFVVAPFGKGEQDYLYDTIDESTKKSIRGAPQGVSSTGQVTNTNDKPVISNDGISDSDYDTIFLDDIASFLPFLEGDPLEEKETSDSNNSGERQLQTLSPQYVLLCKQSDCRGRHVYAGPGFYSSMRWQVENEELSHVYIPPRVSFQYFEDINFGGWSQTFTDEKKGIHLDMGANNDGVSSFIIQGY